MHISGSLSHARSNASFENRNISIIARVWPNEPCTGIADKIHGSESLRDLDLRGRKSSAVAWLSCRPARCSSFIRTLSLSLPPSLSRSRFFGLSSCFFLPGTGPSRAHAYGRDVTFKRHVNFRAPQLPFCRHVPAEAAAAYSFQSLTTKVHSTVRWKVAAKAPRPRKPSTKKEAKKIQFSGRVYYLVSPKNAQPLGVKKGRDG